MQNKYCDLLERKDAQIFTAFNNDQGWFKDLIYNKRGSRIDAYAIDKKNRKCHIEIKQRCGKYGKFQDFIDHFDTIYLDYGKMNEFSEIMLHSGATRDERELFVSIFDEGDTIVVHDLLKPQPTMHMPLQRVWNEATKKWDIEHKIGFYWYNALIYAKENDNYRKLSEEEIDEMKWHTKLVEVIDGEGKVYDGRGNLLKTA
jgi:hypothetical protein